MAEYTTVYSNVYATRMPRRYEGIFSFSTLQKRLGIRVAYSTTLVRTLIGFETSLRLISAKAALAPFKGETLM